MFGEKQTQLVSHLLSCLWKLPCFSPDPVIREIARDSGARNMAAPKEIAAGERAELRERWKGYASRVNTRTVRNLNDRSRLKSNPDYVRFILDKSPA